MSEVPTVSVVIATYNYGRFLAGAIDSVLSQTFQDFEIIIVDDGSTDGTGDVVQAYLGDPRIQYVVTEHLGQPRAKNAAIRRARGKYVAFLDADDLWLPAKLQGQLAVFARGGDNLAVVYCPAHWMDELGRRLKKVGRPPLRGDVLGPLFYRPFICFSTSMVRRDVLEDVGLFDESLPLAIDYDLWLKIGLRYHFDYADEPLAAYRTGHMNLSRRLPERTACVSRIIRRFLDELGGRQRLDPALVRLVLAEHYLDTGNNLAEPSRLRSTAWFLKSMRTCPTYWPAWKQSVLIWLPRPLVACLRRLLGRPDWRIIEQETKPPEERRVEPSISIIADQTRIQKS